MSHPLLTAPIGRSLWRLAGPTTALIVVQIAAGLAEIWIVGRLGTESLAGYVLVIPFAGLMANRYPSRVPARSSRSLAVRRRAQQERPSSHRKSVGCPLRRRSSSRCFAKPQRARWSCHASS